VQSLEIRHFATLTIRTDPDGLYMLGTTSAGKRIIETDDGARVFVHLDGRATWAEQLGQGPIFSTVRLESGDAPYAFVNGLRLVSKGAVGDGGTVAHEIFELV
jgi:hypothetical protein